MSDNRSEPDDRFTSADFHGVVQKQIVNSVFESLASGKMDWELIAPFAEAARRLARSEFRSSSRIRLHTIRSEEGEWVEAEEAFLGISVADSDSGETWLSETMWISDLARAEEDPEQARRIVAALERSIERIRAWLAEQEQAGSGTG